MSSQALTEEQVDEILYCARIGDVNDLKTAILHCIATSESGDTAGRQRDLQLSSREALDVLRAAVTEDGNSALHYASANGHIGESHRGMPMGIETMERARLMLATASNRKGGDNPTQSLARSRAQRNAR